MRRIQYAFSFVLALTAFGTRARSQRVHDDAHVLQWRFHPGSTRYRLRTDQGGPVTTHHTTLAVVDVQTTSVSPSNVATRRMHVSDLRIAGHIARIAREIGLDHTLDGSTLDTTIDATGHVTPDAALTDSSARALAQSTELMFPSLPDHAVRVGDTWSTEQHVAMSLAMGLEFDVTVRTTYTLRSLGDASRRAGIDVAMHLTMDEHAAVSGVALRGQGDARGRSTLRLDRGEVISSELRGELRLDMGRTMQHTRVGFFTSLVRAAEEPPVYATGHDAGHASPVPWLTMLAITTRQAVARTLTPPLFPRLDMTDIVTFAFDDAALLESHQHESGAAWVTPGAASGASLPLLIYLHGVNRFRVLHRWMHGGDQDMRTIIGPLAMDHQIGAMIVAVPSTTGDSAQAEATLYSHFDVARFVDAVDHALAPQGFHVDRQRVILSAHSAAGCVPGNGFLAGIGSTAVQTLLDIDCCMNERTARVLASAPESQRVVVTYQDHMWNDERDYPSFRWTFHQLSAGLASSQRVVQRYDLHSPDAHNDMVRIVLRDWLPRLVPPTN